MTGQTTRRVRVLWGSRSSNGKWGHYAIKALKAAGATYDPDSKTWTVDSEAEFSETTWAYLEDVK